MTITTLTLPGATELLTRARQLEEELTYFFEWMPREKFENEFPILFGDLSQTIKDYREASRAAYFKCGKFEAEVLDGERARLVELLTWTYVEWFSKWHACASCGTRRSPYAAPALDCDSCDLSSPSPAAHV